MERFLKLARIVLLPLLAVCYVKFVRDGMHLYIAIFGDALTNPARVANVVFGVGLTVLGLFAANHFLFKLNALALGMFSAVFAYAFFYLIDPPGSPWVLLSMILEYWHTMVNMILIVASPIVVGWWLNHSARGNRPSVEAS